MEQREKQIKEMITIFETYCEETPHAVCADYTCEECGANAFYNAGYRKQSEGKLRIEITTDDFKDVETAKERGYYRKKFYCPNCDLLIKTETWDSKRMFGCGTVLKSNEMPKFCPNCGAKMKGGEA